MAEIAVTQIRKAGGRGGQSESHKPDDHLTRPLITRRSRTYSNYGSFPPKSDASHWARTGFGQWTGEFIATFGLILTILGTVRFRHEWVPASVALYITAAYWFTSSTSFANPAITIARSITNTFAGIAPSDVPLFIVAQLLGAACAAVTAKWLFDPR